MIKIVENIFKSKNTMIEELNKIFSGKSSVDIEIYGTKLFGDVTSIPKSIITSADSNTKEHRKYTQDKVFRITEDGDEEEILLPDMVDDVVANGGWVRSADVGWYIEASQIKKIFVRADCLGKLQVKNEKHIKKYLGKPDSVKLGLHGCNNYLYTDKLIQLSWSIQDNKFEFIAFGDFSISKETKLTERGKGNIFVDGYRKIKLVELSQSKTYKNLIEGAPTKKLNDRLVERIVAVVSEKTNNFVLIQPKRMKAESNNVYLFL
ncbi:MAG: hypothetical protein JAZ17_17490 [Candidatus Thiodiazotropha endolucinida]|nr:hypothetical protein [Candidatus Thiodiazotropha endolucinida]